VLADIADTGVHWPEVAMIQETRLTAFEDCVEAELTLGRHREVAGELVAMGAQEPLRERTCALLMPALYRCGRQSEALAAYQRLRDSLVGPFGWTRPPNSRTWSGRSSSSARYWRCRRSGCGCRRGQEVDQRAALLGGQLGEDLVDGLRRRQAERASGPPRPLDQIRAAFAPVGRLLPLPDDVTVTAVDAGGVACHWLDAPAADPEQVLLYLHGGGYTLGSLSSHGPLAAEQGALGTPEATEAVRLVAEFTHGR
jgi:phytoene/squalene synthetase